MRHAFSALAGVLMVVLLTIGLVSVGTTAQATPLPPTCTISALGNSNNLTVTCVDPETGVTLGPGEIDLSVLGQQIVVTVNQPGPTVTETATVAGPTKTVKPAPVRVTTTRTVRPKPVRVTETETVIQRLPGDTRTITVSPRPRPAVTVTPRPVVVTETIVNEVTRQPSPQSANMDPNAVDEPFFRGDVDLGDADLSAGEAGIGLASALLLVLLIIAGMYYGFRRGMVVNNREEAFFLRAMLDRSKTG